MFTTIVQCDKCTHYKNKGTIPCCDAYPDGIPNELFADEVMHTKPYKGDNGILFEDRANCVKEMKRERDLGEYDPPIEVNPNPTIEQIEAAWKVAEKYGAKRVKKITIIDESCFCPVDELYKEKLVITETGIKYSYEPRFLDCNQPRSWSYKTTSEAFKVVFNQIAQRSYDMMKYTDEVYITDIIPTKITVTYEDGHKEKNEIYWIEKEFGDVCETLRGLIPTFADMPVFLDDEFQGEK